MLLLYGNILDMPNTGMVVIDWIYSFLWCHVQQSMESAQIYNKTKTGSKGKETVYICYRLLYEYGIKYNIT